MKGLTLMYHQRICLNLKFLKFNNSFGESFAFLNRPDSTCPILNEKFYISLLNYYFLFIWVIAKVLMKLTFFSFSSGSSGGVLHLLGALPRPTPTGHLRKSVLGDHLQGLPDPDVRQRRVLLSLHHGQSPVVPHNVEQVQRSLQGKTHRTSQGLRDTFTCGNCFCSGDITYLFFN